MNVHTEAAAGLGPPLVVRQGLAYTSGKISGAKSCGLAHDGGPAEARSPTAPMGIGPLL